MSPLPRYLVLAAAALSLWAGSAAANSPPFAPIITEPATNGKVVNAADVHMETAPFDDPDPGDFHFCSDFEIWDDPTTQLVWKGDCLTGIGKVHTHLADGTFVNALAGKTELEYERDYFLQVRHQDNMTNWSPYSVRTFVTAPPTAVFPLELDDVLDTPPPTWTGEDALPIALPGGTAPAFLRLESDDGDLLLHYQGAGVATNPPSLDGHHPARIRLFAGDAGPDLLLSRSELAFLTHEGNAVTVYLPPLGLTNQQTVVFWISRNGSTFWGDEGQTEPDFSNLAQGAPVPWTTLEPGFQVEIFATGFQLPVHIAFVPQPGPQPDDPLFYVTELYGNIKGVTRGGTVFNYATNLLNFNPTGNFPGSGELGVAGVAVDPASGDVFASLLYSRFPANPFSQLFPRVLRFHSTNGGFQAASWSAADVVAQRDGEYVGKPRLNQPGADAGTGGSVYLRGTNDYIDFRAPLDFGDEFSILAWVRPDGGSSIQPIAANSESGGFVNGFKFYFNHYPTSDGALVLECGDGVLLNNSADTPAGLITDTGHWYQVAATVSRTGGVADLYVDGVQHTQDGTITAGFAAHQTWRIGFFMNDEFPLKGGIDDVQVYSRRLASNEVAALHQAPGTTAADLLAHYRLDETALGRVTVLDMIGEEMGASHQVSQLSFGPDGMLYVHVGDGFNPATALNTNSYRGKILRVHPDGSAPADNPFYNEADGLSAADYLYAYGLRNPFGGGWRGADGQLYCVENGPSVDRLSRIEASQSYGWTGFDDDMTNRAIYNWDPAHAPVAAVFIETNTFGGSGFPTGKMDRLYVTESGSTYATGPQVTGKRVVEFKIDPAGVLVAGPTTLVEYSGSGKATAAGMAAGPDGLYFTDLYKDLNYATPIDRGANILRIRHIGSADFAASPQDGPAPLAVVFTNTSTLISPQEFRWSFGDGRTSRRENPAHTYWSEGIYDVELRVAHSNGISIRRRPHHIRAGGPYPALLVVNDTNLNSGDLAVRHRLAHLGFSPIEIRTGLDVTDGDAAGKSIVVISSTVPSVDVNTKLRDVAVPVLVWENFLYDDFGMSETEAVTTGTEGGQTRLAIVSNEHFLAAGLAGTVTVVSTPRIFSWGVPDSNAVVAATLEGDPTRPVIFGYESNAILFGVTAAARRVGFFLEDQTADALTHEGVHLFDAAVWWAAGQDFDSDGDGHPDLFDIDDDNDGMLDAYEDEHGLDRLDPGDAGDDPDEDGLLNWQEARADTDPHDSNSVLQLRIALSDGTDGIGLSWDGREEVTYQVEGAPSPTQEVWIGLGDPVTPPEHGDVGLTNATPAETFYYRLLLP